MRTIRDVVPKECMSKDISHIKIYSILNIYESLFEKSGNSIMLRYFFVEKRLAIWNTAKRFCSFHTPCDLYLPFLDSNKERNKDFHMYCFLMILILKDYYINS